MTTPEQIADFVDRRLGGVPRAHLAPLEWQMRERPTVAALGAELFEDTEFLALGLGRFLNTPDGALISEGVSLVLPPFAGADYDLIVEALTFAANAQRRGKWVAAVTGLGLAAVGTGALIHDVRQRAA